jgi:hypothetical protein
VKINETYLLIQVYLESGNKPLLLVEFSDNRKPVSGIIPRGAKGQFGERILRRDFCLKNCH